MKFRVVLALIVLFGFASNISSASAGVRHSNETKSVAEVERYWTPERMAQAQELTADGFAPPPEADAEGAPAGPSLMHRPARNAPAAVGKIYFRWLGIKGTCSGAVIDTPSQRMVLTAAHCLNFFGVWSDYVVFVPSYHRGSRPYGTYFAKTKWVTGPWVRDYDALNYDLGMVVTRRNWNGEAVGDIVGSLPYRAFPRRSGLTRIFGYPAGSNRSREMRQCTTSTWAGPGYSRRSWGPVGRAGRCNMARGSSGGPWLSRYPSASGPTWTVDGVTSTALRNKFATPYFGSHFRRLIYDAEYR